eukprot:TRINITY_DN5818_c0_g1_i6.p1 TRINITY_DN5818_c0_g1~~TRINITY_DN5818_c0_g1_i6.p1  ORF type:complete len:434 (+),score=55.54 TRINITY_DN5818_c0_g1_i6:571-1872(+)
MGEGKMWDHDTQSYTSAASVLAKRRVKPILLKEKEGLAMINGTQFITALGVEALMRSEVAAKSADVILALSFEALSGVNNAFHPRIHEVRNHEGQRESAARARELIPSKENPSELNQKRREQIPRVQDAYSLRCAPQVHGVTHDTLKFVRSILQKEMNSATDNPLIFAEKDTYYNPESDFQAGEKSYLCIILKILSPGFMISGGNFHGEYPAKALDYLCIAIHEIGSISERRLDRMVNPHTSQLPPFLTQTPGLCSGFMIPHCTAAALVSENKVYCHPASIDTIPTSGGQEDHVSMGGFAARKALKVVANIERILAIELLAACQAIDLMAPLKPTEKIQKIHSRIREICAFRSEELPFTEDIESLAKLIKDGELLQFVSVQEPLRLVMRFYRLKKKQAIGAQKCPCLVVQIYSHKFQVVFKCYELVFGLIVLV